MGTPRSIEDVLMCVAPIMQQFSREILDGKTKYSLIMMLDRGDGAWGELAAYQIGVSVRAMKLDEEKTKKVILQEL